VQRAGLGQESGQGVGGSMQQAKRNRNRKRGETEGQIEVCAFIKICGCVYAVVHSLESREEPERGERQHKYAHYHNHNNTTTNQWDRGHKPIKLTVNPDR